MSPKLIHFAQRALLLTAIFFAPLSLPAQIWIEYVPSEPPKSLPVLIDSNTASFWKDGRLHTYSSTSHPVLNVFDKDFQVLSSTPIRVDSERHFPMWIESVWKDGAGKLYAWYHHEVVNLCPGSNYTSPEIGAMVSTDGGLSFHDLGVVLRSGDPVNCSAQNGYFATGHGDFSVIVDESKEWVYFLFGSYGGDVSGQGIAMARMPIEYLDQPVGAVWKYFNGGWSEPGLSGRNSPIFPAGVSWAERNTDAFWGPSVHWNTYLQAYIVLMNRSCCDTDWPQEGVYITINPDLNDPTGWTEPFKVVDGGDWYPWFQGAEEGETSSRAGQRTHLFLRQTSEWDILFRLSTELPQPEDPVDGEQGVEPPPPPNWFRIPGSEKLTKPGALFTGFSQTQK
ncbi:MAG: hypothetical protein JNK48_08720 [Bryobacterales bacterium]|nr:hypothetical protein [Bryobacterales bacterium]